MNTKRLIEKKQSRLYRFWMQGRITKQLADEQVKQYARLAVKILGD